MKIKKYNLIYFFYLLVISSSVHADYLMGVEAYKDKNYALAFENWSKNDQQDNLLSQFYLALLYKNGLGVDRDYKKAFSLLNNDIYNSELPLLKSFDKSSEFDFSADTIKKFSKYKNIILFLKKIYFC